MIRLNSQKYRRVTFGLTALRLRCQNSRQRLFISVLNDAKASDRMFDKILSIHARRVGRINGACPVRWWPTEGARFWVNILNPSITILLSVR
jgi:hypothetical protein